MKNDLIKQLRTAMHKHGVTINDTSLILEDCKDVLSTTLPDDVAEMCKDLQQCIEQLEAALKDIAAPTYESPLVEQVEHPEDWVRVFQKHARAALAERAKSTAS